MGTKLEWEGHADRCLAKITGNTPADIMLRASFEHSKTWVDDDKPADEDEWLNICRGEIEAMITALREQGYVIRSDAI